MSLSLMPAFLTGLQPRFRGKRVLSNRRQRVSISATCHVYPILPCFLLVKGHICHTNTVNLYLEFQCFMSMQNIFTIFSKLEFYWFHLTLFTFFSQSKLTSNVSSDISDFKKFNVKASGVKGEFDFFFFLSCNKSSVIYKIIGSWIACMLWTFSDQRAWQGKFNNPYRKVNFIWMNEVHLAGIFNIQFMLWWFLL